MLFYLIIFIELIFFTELMLRIRLLTAAHLILAYIVISQIVFWNAQDMGYREDLEALPSAYLYLTMETVGVYAGMFLAFYLSTIGIRIANSKKIFDDVRSSIVQARQLQIYMFIFVVTVFTVDLISMDRAILWRNFSYLLITSRDGLIYQNVVSRFFHSLASVATIIAVFGFFSSLFSGRRRWALLWFAPALWAVAQALASASRHSAVLMFVPVVLGMVMLRRGRLLVVLVFGAASIVALAAAIWARGNGEFGLAAIPGMLGAALDGAGDLNYLLFNLFQGIFVTGDSLLIGGVHPERYRILSLSPFPSFIDGFDQILDIDQIRIHLFVPMSAVAEVILFGWIYTFIFFAVFCATVRASIRLAQKSGILYILFTPYAFLMFVIANAYPVRNVFRLVLYMLVISFVVSAVFDWFRLRRRSQVVAPSV